MTRLTSTVLSILVLVSNTGNEAEVGEGIRRSGVPREEIFLTTKLGNRSHRNPAEALDASLSKLGTDYLDLCASMFATMSGQAT